MRALPAICSLTLLLAGSAVGALSLYGAKPPWWDSVSISVPEGAETERALYEQLSQLERSWRESASGHVLGPLVGSLPDSLELPLAPESGVDLARTLPARGGGVVRWQAWTEGQDCPVDTARGPALVYQTIVVERPGPGSAFLVVSAQDVRFAAWLNGIRIHADGPRDSDSRDRPAVVPLALPGGTSRLLLKYHRLHANSWRFSARVEPEHPVHRAAKLRSLMAAEMSRKGHPPKHIAGYARHLVNDYLALRDDANTCHWARYAIAHAGSDRSVRDMIRWLTHHAGRRGQWRWLERFIRPMVTSAEFGPEARADLVKTVSEALLHQYRPGEVLPILDTVERCIDIPPRDTFLYRVRALLWLGDYGGARTACEGARASVPDMDEDRSFRELSQKAEALRGRDPSLAVEHDVAAVAGRAEELAGGASRLPLVRFIREALASRSTHVRETDDPDLFTPAVRHYRTVLAPHAHLYEPTVTPHVELLARTLGLSKSCEARRLRQLSLVPQGQPATASASGSLIRPLVPPLVAAPGPGQASAGTHLAYSCLELDVLEDSGDRRVRWPDLGPVRCGGSWVLAQSSRHLAAFRAGLLRWEVKTENSTLLTGDNRDRTEFVFRGLSAATDGTRVYARLLDRGRFRLSAYEVESGSLVWTCAPGDHALCSDPVVHGESIALIAKHTSGLSDYHLLLLDRTTGKVEDKLYLFAGSSSLDFHGRYASSARFDDFLPAPLVRGDVAYVDATAGVLAAVDLADNSIRWARRYRGVAFGLDERLARLAYERRPSSPVMGKGHVLFAPQDCLHLLLVESDTGELAARNATLQWRSVHPWTDAEALVVGLDARELLALSMADLSVTRTFAATRGWRWLATDGERAFLQRDVEIGVLGGEGTFEAFAALEQGSRAVGIGPEGVVSVEPGDDAFALSVAGAPSGRADAPGVPPQPEGAVGYVVQPRIDRTDRGVLVTAENYVVALTEDLRPTWSYPVREAPAHIATRGDQLVLVSGNRLRCLDASTGQTRFSYPPEGANWRPITGVASVPSGVLACFWHDWGQSCVMRLGPDDTWTALGLARNVDGAPAILASGERIVGHRRGVATVQELDPDEGVYLPTEVECPGEKAIALEDGRVVVMKPRSSVAVLDGDIVRPVELAKGPLDWRWPRPHVEEGVVSCWNFRTFWTVVDARSATDLGHVARWLTPASADDSRAYGVVRRPGEKGFAVGWYDRRERTFAHIEPVPLDDFGDASFYERHASPEFSFRRDGRVYHVLDAGHDRGRSRERLVLEQESVGYTLRIHRVPGYGVGHSGVAGRGHVLLCVDDTMLRLTDAQFDRWLSSPSPMGGSWDDKRRVLVDGFADEWQEQDLHRHGTHLIGGLLSRGTVFLALQIRDEGFIQRLGVAGLTPRVKLFVCPGGLLGLRSSEAYTPDRLLSLADTDIEGWRMAYHVSPTGQWMWIEAAFPLEAVAGFDDGTMRRIASRSALGDLALNLVLEERDGTRMGLFAAPTDPSGHPRIMFERP